MFQLNNKTTISDQVGSVMETRGMSAGGVAQKKSRSEHRRGPGFISS